MRIDHVASGRKIGCLIVDGLRRTGDGYCESLVLDLDGIRCGARDQLILFVAR